ncbi:MAG: AAA family ATPase [Eubacterium callanderi]|uniref:phage NrS-1 polymerase family protein n=1 Tax=Eubacterium callanderi TaxID=53442 RepID=UPI002671E03B|nr:AAA family ATPase [Eubacterium callanderi]
MAYNYDSVPDGLKQLPQWVVWKKETDEKGKVKKVPRNPITGYGASSTDPETWNTFITARDIYEETKGYDGIGFVFNNSGIVGIDLDHCIDETGQMTETAQEIIQVLDSYTEYSPSGTGVHIYAYGTLPVDGKKKEPYEMYQNKRYFTVTGQSFHNPPKQIQYKGPEILKIYERLFPQVEAPAQQPISGFSLLNADEVVNRIRASRQGQTFEALYQGDISAYPSQSEADMALCNILAFWCAKDAQMMDAIFRQSGLYRPKWDVKHGPETYGNITIQKAIAGTTEVYTPKKEMYGHKIVTVEGGQNSPGLPEVIVPQKLMKSADVECEDIKWLWYPYFPKHKLALILGEAGSGKTYFALKIAAIVSGGKVFWTDNPLEDKKPGIVFYLSGEDGAGDTLKARLQKMGADENMVYFMEDGNSLTPLTFNSPQLEQWIKEYQPAVIIFDPIQGFLDKTVDANNQIQIRHALIGVKALAEKYDFTPICIMHPNKDKRMSANDRASGSKDFVNFARSVVVIGRDADDKSKIIMGHSKSNLAPHGSSLSFEIEQIGFDEMGRPISGDFLYTGISGKTPDQILSGAESKKKPSPVLDEALEFLRELLKENGGKVKPADARKQAEEIGISRATLDRAREQLRIKSKHEDGNNWYWVEPEEIIERDTS